jgi:hypothetical protein
VTGRQQRRGFALALLAMVIRAEHQQGGNELASTIAQGSGTEASKKPQQNGEAKGEETWAVALMFLTTGEEKNAEVWARWLKNAKKGEYNIYIHPKVIIFRANPTFGFAYAPTPLFAAWHAATHALRWIQPWAWSS